MASFWNKLGYFLDKSRYPQFLIIGVQKAGTTTLYDLLNSYPIFGGSADKETGFFSNDVFYAQGKKWYAQQFTHCDKNAITFEATPFYLYDPKAAQRIFSFNKRMKFIVVLREPAERCHSAWNMFRQFNASGAEQIFQQFIQHSNPPIKQAISELLFTKHFPSFKQAVEEDMARYLSQSTELEPSFVRRGIYSVQIANYLSYFSLNNFLFLEQKELATPVSVIQKIADFLQVAIDIHSVDNHPIASNVGHYLSDNAEDEEMLQLLRNFYKPHNEALFNQIGIRYDWNETRG